jgi:16S rRNA G527 N7-methylase RsmG
VARPGLKLVLTEASGKKAGFLRSVLVRSGLRDARVLERQIQRAEDLGETDQVRVLVTRAMGSWEKVVPRLASRMTADAQVLLWAGAGQERIFARKVWQRFRPAGRHPLPGRDRSWIWYLRRA